MSRCHGATNIVEKKKKSQNTGYLVEGKKTGGKKKTGFMVPIKEGVEGSRTRAWGGGEWLEISIERNIMPLRRG